MGYDSLVKNNVRKAFNKIKDLAIVVTFSSRNASSFDFNENESIKSAAVSVAIKCLEESQERKDNTLIKKLLCKTEDLYDPAIYDTVTFADGSKWTCVQPYLNDGYLTKVTVSKEA